MSTATVSNTAWLICEATARFQISAYSRYRSSSILPSTSAGVIAAEVGRMASCASWAFFDLVL